MKNKNIAFKNFDIKEYKAHEDGTMKVTAYGAVFGNVDSYGDVIVKGAFEKTLVERKGRIAICLQHDIFTPVAKLNEAKEDDFGLLLDVTISASEQGVQTKIKEGILKELSIGYRTVNSNKGTVEEQEVNFLTEIKLFEVSFVTIAANPLALVQTMKSEERKNHIEEQFDRIIAITRNDNLKFELHLLKALCTNEPQNLDQGKSTLEVKEPQLSKSEILNALNL